MPTVTSLRPLADTKGNHRDAMRGFTLFELVVVLSIITVLATMAMVGYQAGTPPGAVSAARNELHGLLRFARQQAIMRGSNAMLIINYDSSDREKFLRYAGVIVEEEYDSTIWKAAHSGVYLPQGVYFVPQPMSAVAFDSNWISAAFPPSSDARSQYNCSNSSGSPNAIGAIEYPVLNTVELKAIVTEESVGDERNWIGYQFGPDGRVKGVDFNACSAGNGSQSNHMVVGIASYQASGELLFEDSDKTLGVAVRLNGVSYAVDDPSAL